MCVPADGTPLSRSTWRSENVAVSVVRSGSILVMEMPGSLVTAPKSTGPPGADGGCASCCALWCGCRRAGVCLAAVPEPGCAWVFFAAAPEPGEAGASADSAEYAPRGADPPAAPDGTAVDGWWLALTGSAAGSHAASMLIAAAALADTRARARTRFRIAISLSPWGLAFEGRPQLPELGHQIRAGTRATDTGGGARSADLRPPSALLAGAPGQIDRRSQPGRGNIALPCEASADCARRPQVLAEPADRQVGHLVEGSGFLEQVARAGHHPDLAGARQPAAGHLVPLGDPGVAAADDQQHRRADLLECRPGQVRAAAAGDHGADTPGARRGRGQGGGRSGASPKQPQRQACGLRGVKPVDRAGQPPGEQADVEPERGGLRVGPFLTGGQQVQQQRAEPCAVQAGGDRAVARALPGASAAVV